MSKHSNKQIEKHVDDSATLLDKMNVLTQKLQENLYKDFEQGMGCPLPNILLAKVRQTEVVMVYATDPKLDEYINGARKVLNAALTGDTSSLINGILDVVEVVASRIIGSGDVKVGVHSSAVRTGELVTAVFSAVEKASAKDWATAADFFVAYYAFVVFKPSTPQATLLARRPSFAAAPKAPSVDTKALAARNYAYRAL